MILSTPSAGLSVCDDTIAVMENLESRKILRTFFHNSFTLYSTRVVCIIFISYGLLFIINIDIFDYPGLHCAFRVLQLLDFNSSSYLE